MDYTSFLLSIEDHIATVSFNRAAKANSLHEIAWDELSAIFKYLHQEPSVRVIILQGEGKHFCAGIDLSLLMSLQKFQEIECEARKREKLREFIFWLQDAITAIEECRKPVIAAIQGACVGGGLDIAAACDMRYCSEDAYFSIKEIDLGLVADIGSLQRLPKVMPPAIVAEMAYTGRNMSGAEAATVGLVNRCLETPAALQTAVKALAKNIAAKSPLCIRGIKEMLLYSRDHDVKESLNYMTAWNASMLLSKDLMEAFA
ncbi:MAG: crotonase/enoyl-CoA hydratase family protein, partial [Bacteroidota bacterium]